MENDDLDYVDIDPSYEEDYTTNQDDSLDEFLVTNEILDLEEAPEEDFISELLRSRGIDDMSKIKFEDEYGDIEEVNWNELSNEDKFNVLSSSYADPETELDDSEINLINAIRSSQLSPQEYIQAVLRNSVNNFVQNSQSQQPYRVDEISDDDLYVLDLISRTLDLTEEEAFEALDRAKQNETLYNKLIGAIRKEYQLREAEQLQLELYNRLQAQLQQYNVFANSIYDSVNNFTDLAGGKLDMDPEDMQELYEFITGFDAAGISHFGKALNDPDVLVRMAWFALNGEDTIRSMEDYYTKEITKAREEGYKRGLQKAKDNPQVVYKKTQKPNQSELFDDLDDF